MKKCYQLWETGSYWLSVGKNKVTVHSWWVHLGRTCGWKNAKYEFSHHLYSNDTTQPSFVFFLFLSYSRASSCVCVDSFLFLTIINQNLIRHHSRPHHLSGSRSITWATCPADEKRFQGGAAQRSLDLLWFQSSYHTEASQKKIMCKCL